MKILLAEDDAFFQNFYSRKIAERGHEVRVAHDGDEAIQLLLQERPDILLLDLIMPKKDGFEVLTEVAKYPQLKGLPILVFSTLGQESDIEKALKLGARGYLNKTFFDFDKLLAKVVSVASQ